MKRSLLFLLLLALFMPWAAQAQNELTVYEDGTNNNGYVPFYGLYADTQGALNRFILPMKLQPLAPSPVSHSLMEVPQKQDSSPFT